MKVTAYIRQTSAKNNITDKAHIFFRVRDGKTDIKCASELIINPNHWSAERQGYKQKVTRVHESEQIALNKAVKELTTRISERYYQGADSAWLKRTIFEYHHPQAYKYEGSIFTDTKLLTLIECYIKKRNIHNPYLQSIKCLVKKLERFEVFQRRVRFKAAYSLRVDAMTKDDLDELSLFLAKEHEYFTQYQSFYKSIGVTKPIEQRSDNTIHGMLNIIRSIFNWIVKQGITDNNPFEDYELPPLVYGTPYYITIEERDAIYRLDLKKESQLMLFRDIFVFQCLVGCRQGDIHRFTQGNIIDGCLEYIPKKTKEKSARVVRVPLHDTAKEIVSRYTSCAPRLFPEFRLDSYNKAIKAICRLAGVTRMVSIRNPRTHMEENKPLCEIASSHMARRTFVGNLYKKVKDPSLIASMSGHADGSRSFARYRSIDDDMKRELINLIQ